MARLQTFLTYALVIIGFFLVSVTLENGLIKNMYYDMTGTVDSNLNFKGENINLDLQVTEAKSTKRNGYINLQITNNSNTPINEAYIKVELYTKSDVHAITKYMEINNLKPGDSKNYVLNFKGSYIKTYKITCENQYPDKDAIFTMFGYEINTRNIFGMDLSNVISARSLGEFTQNIFHSVSVTVKSIPWWGWLWAWTIVARYLVKIIY